MDWLTNVGSVWLSTLAWLVGFTIVFGVLVRLTPCNPGMYWWKNLRAVATDFVYWFIVPLFLRACRLGMVIVGVALLFAGNDPDFLPVKKLPLWQQCLAILLIQDVLLYTGHRIFHTRLGWKFHAVHHSPTVLDWTSTSRFHPVNLLFAGNFADVAVLLMGFSPAALFVLTPFNIIYSAMVHANLNWTFGPFKYVFASPVFHRWHHTTMAEGLDKNFASTFPVLDLIFGTFYMPPGKLPEHFGDPDFPEGFWGQFLYPFKGISGGLAWMRRRPLAASLLAGSVFAAVSVLGGGIFTLERLAERNEQLAREVEQAKMQQLQAETDRSAAHLDMARRAGADNDLAAAAIFLDGMAGSSYQSGEQQRLRDLCRRKCLILKGHGRAVTSVAVNRDHQMVVSGSDDGLVKVWDAHTGKETLSFQAHTRPVRGVAISADGLWIVSASFDGLVKVWDAGTGKEALTLKGHTGAILSVAVSADGRRIVSGSADFTAKVWDAATGKEKFSLNRHTGAVTSVAVSADGGCIAAANAAVVKVWDGESGQEKRTLQGHRDLVYSLAISPDGQRVVSGSFDETVKVWEAGSGKALLTLEGHKGPIYGVAISQDGGRIVSGGKDKLVKVWDARTGKEQLSLKGHMDSVTTVAVNGDGRCIVSGSADGTIAVWDAWNCAVRDQVDLTRQD